FKKLKTRMLLSSIVVGGQLQPNASAKKSRDNPLIRDGQELIPSVNHVFTSDQHAYFYYEVYEPGKPVKVEAPPAADTGGNGKAAGQSAKAATPQKPAQARVLSSVAFFNGKTKVFETPVVEVREIGAPDRKAAIF